MTSLPSESLSSNAVTAGRASDIKTFVAAAMLTFGAGMVVLVGTQLLDVFGFILGLIAAGVGIFGWRKAHGRKFFPRDLPAKSMVLLTVVTTLFTLIAWLLA